MLESIGEVKARRGETVYGSLDFEGMKVPVVIAQGRSDGPTLLVIGLQHATEFSGPAAVDSALETLKLDALAGTLVCLPVVNPIQVSFSYEQHSAAHKNPETNLNRQWPGDAKSENQFSRLTALMWSEAVVKCDALIDFHCCRTVDPRFAAASEGHKPSEELASAVGLEAIDLQTEASYARGLLFVHSATDLDKASLLVESHPGGGFQVREAVEACAGVITRALAHLGMIESAPPPEPPRSAPPIFRRAEKATEIKNQQAGYLAPRRWAGQRVGKGQAVAVVRSIETFEILETLTSPLDGAVGCMGAPGRGLVEPGVVVATVKPAG